MTTATTIKPEGKSKHNAATVERDLRRRIASGSLQRSAPLPSLRDLSRHYGVAVNTVTRAVKSLVEDGSLRSEGIRGTYVAEAPLDLAARADTDLPRFASPRLATPASIAIVAYLDSPTATGNKNWGWLGVRAIEQAFIGDENATLVCHNRYITQETEVPLDQTIRELDAQRPDAMAVIFPRESNANALIDYAAARDIPLALLIDEEHHGPRVCEISFDDVSAAYDAAMHLIRRGFSQIAVYAPFPIFWADKRLAGVRQAVQAVTSLTTEPIVSKQRSYGHPDLPGISQEDFACHFAGEFLDRLPAGAGVVAVNDHCAVGLARAAADRGMQVGREYGLVSFDDIPDSRQYGVTSMRPPVNEMGYEAARVLSLALNGGTMPDKIVLRSQLVPRTSTLRVY